jgi:predicted AAA+ superfamily ATPase
MNLSSLANDCGINHNTAKSWLSVLEASYVIFLVRPHHANFGKRLVKSPKLYFTDVGFAAYLLDIHDTKHISNHPLKGPLFENFVATELLKSRLNYGKSNNLYFFRDNVGNEVDLLLENDASLRPVEIKLGSTISEDFFKGLRYYLKINKKNSARPVLIYGGKEDERRGNFDVFSYRNTEKVNLQ